MPISRGALPHWLTVTPRDVITEDRYGNQRRGDGDPIRVRGRVDLVDTRELITDREEQRETYTVILEPTVSVDGWDRVTWEAAGFDLEVDGPAVAIWDAVGVHHLELAAYRSRG